MEPSRKSILLASNFSGIAFSSAFVFIDVQYSEISGVWTIKNKSTDKGNVLGKTTYGTADKTAYELIEDALNLKSTTVKVKVEVDGKERYVVEPTKTAQARAKQEIIMQKFKEWLFADKSRRDDLVETYNRIYNSSRPREFDGSHLNFVGMNPEITLRPRQHALGTRGWGWQVV